LWHSVEREKTDAGMVSFKASAVHADILRLFFKGSPTPATIVPLEGLMPADEVLLGAPCKLWYVADVA
jgi:hypothetical protein